VVFFGIIGSGDDSEVDSKLEGLYNVKDIHHIIRDGQKLHGRIESQKSS